MKLRPYNEESFKYAHRRRTFGKPLIEHPVIRAKLADMVVTLNPKP
jgi:alkylation response protein AidB-like acyl-CoA dehydrogenase